MIQADFMEHKQLTSKETQTLADQLVMIQAYFQDRLKINVFDDKEGLLPTKIGLQK